MKQSVAFILLILLASPVFSQKAIEITSKEHAAYQKIPGTQLSIVLPENYVPSKRFNGYENPLATASIMVFKVPGSINENMFAFKRNKDISQGMVVAKEELFRINGYDALLQSGVQFAHGKAYMRYVFVIGDLKNTYVLNASWVKDDHFELEAKRIKKALLGIIFSAEDDTPVSDAFDFTVDPGLAGLKEGNILMNSLVFTDDGQIPSETEAKTAFMINETLIPKGEDHKLYLQNVLKAYPIEYSTKQDINPSEIEIEGFEGLEVYAIGTNTKLHQSELIYIVLLFDGNTVYQMTGTSLKNYEEALSGFKKMARSLTFKTKE